MVDFISMPVTSGFTSATSIIIIVSQLQGLLGLRFKAHDVTENLIKIFKNIRNVRFPDLALGCCCIAFLLCFKVSSQSRSTTKTVALNIYKFAEIKGYRLLSPARQQRRNQKRQKNIFEKDSLVSIHLSQCFSDSNRLHHSFLHGETRRISVYSFRFLFAFSSFYYWRLIATYKSQLMVINFTLKGK